MATFLTFGSIPKTIQAYHCEFAGKHEVDGGTFETERDDVYMVLDEDGTCYTEITGSYFRKTWAISQ